MSTAGERLRVEDLELVADALSSGRIRGVELPTLRRLLGGDEAEALAAMLGEAGTLGASREHIAWTLRLLARERRARRAARDDIELVWTGPEEGATASRDTRVVVRDLFEHAERSLLIASYLSTDHETVFAPLARRMDAAPSLQVRMYVNIKPPKGSATTEQAIADFARGFRDAWPGSRPPEIFYDPRTAQRSAKERPSMHAKCVIADGSRLLVTSANFTEAAQLRNIEVGVLLRDPPLAAALTQQFENLVVTGALRAVAAGPRAP